MSDQRSTWEAAIEALIIILKPLTDDFSSGKDLVFIKEALGVEIIQDSQIIRLRQSLSSFIHSVDELSQILNENDPNENINLEQIARIGTAVLHVYEGISSIKSAFETIQLPLNYPSSEIPNRIVNYLIYLFLNEFKFPLPILEFAGIYTSTPANPSPNTYVKHHFDFGKLIQWLSQPQLEIEKLFSTEARIIQKLEKILNHFNVFSTYSSEFNLLDIFGSSIIISPHPATNGLQIISNVPSFSVINDIQRGDWNHKFTSNLNLPNRFTVLLDPKLNLSVLLPENSALPNSESHLSISYESVFEQSETENNAFLLLGEKNKSRLELGGFSYGIKLDFKRAANNKLDSSISIEGKLKGGKLILDFSESDSFLQSFLPEKTNLNFELGLGFSIKSGFYFTGGAALEINIPQSIDLEIAKISNLIIGIKPENGKIPISLGTDVSFELGPAKFHVENIGLSADFSFPTNGGNLGPLNLDLGFKAPTGLGISINSAGFSGSGALKFDSDKGEYSGFLFLDFKGICSIRTFGILNTKLPNGEPGYSFALVFCAGFEPEIQIGMGFTISRIGGIIGLNRKMNVEPLRLGLKEGTLDRTLFLNASEINGTALISDLQRVFPVADSRFVFGPVARMGWGTPTLLTIDLALLIEVPDPVKVAVLGVVKTALPSVDSAVLKLNCAFVGEFNMERKELYFYTTIYDSRLLWFTLSGDMLFLLKWGDDANFVLSVGGFHHSYKAPALPVPPLKRLTINLLADHNPRLTIESYFAITSNSVQFGAKAELFIDAWIFSVYGMVSFDVLFQFSPFHFVAEMAGMLEVRLLDQAILSISLNLTLEGPTPWHAHGTASFSIFVFITIDVGFDISWGESSQLTFPKENVYAKLIDSLNDVKNWKATIPIHLSQYVSMRELENPEGILVFHPMGILEISQKTVPLNLDINKFGNTKPEGESRFAISKIKLGSQIMTPGNGYTAIREQFALGQFVELSKEESYTHPSFEELESGIQIDQSNRLALAPMARKRSLEYEMSYFGDPKPSGLRQLDSERFNRYRAYNATAQSPVAKKIKQRINTQHIPVQAEEFIIADMDSLQPLSTQRFGSSIEAAQAMKKLLAQQPELAENAQYISTHQLQTA